MPDLGAVRTQLEARLADLLAEAKEIDAELSEPHSRDWEERATESEGDEVLEGLGHAALAEARRIHAALTRIDEGTYGICVSCGEPVGEKRLEAVPHAPLCIDCASRQSGSGLTGGTGSTV